MNKFSYFLNPHAINVLLYRMKPRKHIYVKYCRQTYFKSIGTLSQIFKNHTCQRTINLARKPARLPRGWNMIFISRNMIFVLCDHCSNFYPLFNQINLFMVINIWGIIKYFILQSVHLLYKYAIRINICFIRTRRIHFSY